MRSRSSEATEGLGEQLAAALRPGDVIALQGPLGAGKTRFVAGIARGLACAARVRSPSFAIVNEYRGRLLLVHLDLYRLEPRDLGSLGIEEYLERGVVVAEWGEKLPAACRHEALEIRMSGSDDERFLVASAHAGRGLELLRAWEAIVRSGATSHGEAAP